MARHCRDWDQSDNYPASLGNDSSAWALKAKVLLVELLVAIKNFLAHRSELTEGLAEQRLTAHKGDSQLAGLFKAEHTLELRTDSVRRLLSTSRGEGGERKGRKGGRRQPLSPPSTVLHLPRSSPLTHSLSGITSTHCPRRIPTLQSRSTGCSARTRAACCWPTATVR